jgi:hypothetical protein
MTLTSQSMIAPAYNNNTPNTIKQVQQYQQPATSTINYGRSEKRNESTKIRSSGINDSDDDTDKKSKVQTAISNDRAMLSTKEEQRSCLTAKTTITKEYQSQ